MPNKNREQETLDVYRNLESQEPRTYQYNRLVLQAQAIFMERNKLYRDAFVGTGVFGAFAVMAGDIERLRTMIYHGKQLGLPDTALHAQIHDKLLDVVNQAIITLMMVEEHNWTGKAMDND